MPIELDPIKSAQKGAEYSGFYRLQDLKRFSDMVRNESGEILVDLKCKHNEQGLAVLLVSAQTDVQLTCERCCGAMEQHLEIETVFTPETRNLDEDQVPTDYEIVAIDEFGMIDFRQLVEDEIILSIPLLPKHAETDCGVSSGNMSWGELDESQPEKENPFEALKKLKIQKD